ncbi:MAG: peptide chain release factor N(5)-glutamine methyltransferase [Candidatus Gracilibacteria bacterium]|nr:peptide chain release factor N(5)-glutamine methyltransferase [Candidatus Gracilibacteria bacterium]
MKKQELIKYGKNKYNLDSKTINQVLEFVLNIEKKDLFILDTIEEKYLKKTKNIFKKLSTGYPLVYITKEVNFMGNDFYIDKNVLIPRDDTEILVKETIKYIKSKTQKNSNIYNPEIYHIRHSEKLNTRHPEFISGSLMHRYYKETENNNKTSKNQNIFLLDIGTGSGIIPISIAKNTNIEKIIAIDISKKALNITKKNIKLHSLKEIIKPLNKDFKDFDFKKLYGTNLIITANLPYIKEKDFKNMDFGVYTYEPEIALYGGKNTGFEIYEELINILLLEKDNFNTITLFIEIGFDQYEISKDYLISKGLKFEFFKDTNNIYRTIKINLKN